MQKTRLMLEVENKMGKNLEKYLPRKYNHDHMSSKGIAENLDVHPTTVRRWLNKIGIQIRDCSQSNMSKNSKRLSSYDLGMIYKYIIKPVRKVADECKVNIRTVYRWLEYDGIERRHGSNAHLPFGSRKPSKKELERVYSENNYSLSKTARFFNIWPKTVKKWLRREGLFVPCRRRRSVYDNINLRKEMLDEIVLKANRDADNLRVEDFRRIKKEDGRSYFGLLEWYESRYGCDPSEAIKMLMIDRS